MNEEKMASFVQFLLDWSKNNTRDFPWRKTKDPYKILVAEIMLQRTKAEQVVPVYEKFITKYTNIRSICKASVSDITKAIASLGLEKRAQGMKKLAEQMANKYGFEIPKTEDELLKIHWVGKYIANAILCHAYGADVPTVDVNFARVLVRVFSLESKGSPQKDKRIWDFAKNLMALAKGKGGTLNLAILDLASNICTSRKQKHELCPLNTICDYYCMIPGQDNQ
jgi:A/G-specific adenine glycosylase